MAEESVTIRKLREQFADRVQVLPTPADGMDTVKVKREDILDVCMFLRTDGDLDYDLMRDLTCVDYIHEKPRFEVVYHLYSIYYSHAVRLKVRLEERDPAIDTVTGVWVGANWYEREAYDLYGIKFNNHPDLRRILLYPEFVGHPLRKDYPIDKEQPLFEEREETKGVR
ncbi:MAG: NADH-quinone oxidoreductase subunit C [Candidatus Abyssobacteria bacterium SURF_17]|jgi:NADH-quinone oxidoreductase subunit C|uniref:NADH-quinone oxidoreductase subunit C n=1 Tax=Candidatus Abyssobacteria bacterium SURF_17 TaxID=2093361 RepID=A0A419EW96_9BACT|nr:MAG: NADH-quinone oxidoreductase subunit C [Candidatus Abyssubacteria bacterium SURF_17]